MEKITQQELKNVIDREEKGNVLDVRTLKEYLDFRIENIPFIPLELLNHIRQPEPRWYKSEPVYVISYTEARSKAFCHKLDALGYRTFYVEEGGVEAWCRKHLSVVSTIDYQSTDKSALAITNGTGSNPTFNFEITMTPSPSFGHYFRWIVGIAWFFEKMNCNIKFVFAKRFNYFENSILKVSQESSSNNYIALRLNMQEFQGHCMWITSEYAYMVMSRLTIKRKIREKADKWAGTNLKGNWIGVHFRGTDAAVVRRHTRNFIELEVYMSYLKRVIDKNYSIFVCSDQAQFIDRMNKAFPGRVFSRSIRRSYNNINLHMHHPFYYRGSWQRKDALIDLLVLSKANLIYKTAGAFSDLTRFFNPAIKIISLIAFDRQYLKCFPENFIPIPKAHLLVK